MSVSRAQAHSRVANQVKHAKRSGGDPTGPAVLEARRQFAELKIRDYVSKVLETAPPLEPEQRQRLAALFSGPPGVSR